jgi:hypothetical protein
MPQTLEMTIRDGATVYYTAAAKIDDDFARRMFNAYITYYPEAPNDDALFYDIVRGTFQGILNNIIAVEINTVEKITAPSFAVLGTRVVDLPPLEPKTEEKVDEE